MTTSKKNVTAELKGLSKETAAAIAKMFVGVNLTTIGKIKVFPNGIPAVTEPLVSVLPASQEHANLLVNSLLSSQGYTYFKVFPYGIPPVVEAGRIDIAISTD